MYNGRMDLVEYVSHFNQRMTIHSKNEPLMCKVFLSNLGPAAMRWFNSLKVGSIDSFKEITQAFGSRLGMTMGRGRAGPKDGIFAPIPHGLFLPHPRPAPHDRENFLPHPRPLRPYKALPYLVKLYFLSIFPTIIAIFSNKHISIIKIYFKL